MFDLVPFAGAGRKVANRNIQPRLIGEFLQFEFPQPQPPPVASAAVGGDQNRLGMWIDASAFHAPPSANGGHGKSAGVMVGSHIDKTGVASDVVNTIRIGARNGGAGEVVTLDLAGLFCRQLLPTGIVVVSYEFFLLGVYRNHRAALVQAFLHRGVNVPKLRVAIGVIGTLLGFAIALQAIVQVVKNLRDLHVTDGMFLLVKFPSNRPRAFTNPSQRRLRVPARLRIDQPFQRLHQARIGLRDGLASRPGPTQYDIFMTDKPVSPDSHRRVPVNRDLSQIDAQKGESTLILHPKVVSILRNR